MDLQDQRKKLRAESKVQPPTSFCVPVPVHAERVPSPPLPSPRLMMMSVCVLARSCGRNLRVK